VFEAGTALLIWAAEMDIVVWYMQRCGFYLQNSDILRDNVVQLLLVALSGVTRLSTGSSWLCAQQSDCWKRFPTEVCVAVQP
jgi:hypothetical protein